jgi:CRP-like cAMP-binding protein
MRKVFYILEKLTDEDAQWLISVGEKKTFNKGACLIREGEHINALIFLLSGQVSVEVSGVGELAVLGSGEILGEMSLVDESPPSASVIAVTQASVLTIDRAAIDQKLAADPAFAARLYRAIAMFLSVRLRRTVAKLGYGSAAPSSEEEIDLAMLETVNVSGARFDRMIKALMGAD